MRAPLHPGEFRFEACALDADGVARELLLEVLEQHAWSRARGSE